ncbi:Fructose-1,6-bisphosphatase class 1 [uncultured archaeon]|nr:Fructose-1,6-bisphosphatase class 1 [uncultured archaeon]
MSEPEVLLKDHLSTINRDVAELIEGITSYTLPILREFPSRRGEAGTRNDFGEDQKALDVWVNDYLTDKLLDTDLVKTVVSEENLEPLSRGKGKFLVTLDPLDGSNNIKSNNLFGTIFGIWKHGEFPTEGRKQVAAIYKLYGPVSTMVVATEHGVDEYVKSRKGEHDGEYVVSKENVKFPAPTIYSVGGNPDEWVPEFDVFMRLIRQKGLKQRYCGSFVGDFNQIMFHGGVFAYPALIRKPEGKLRLLFEAAPMAFICAKAGGASSNGARSLLDVKPKSIDQRTPVYVGDADLIRHLQDIFESCSRARDHLDGE